MTRPSGANGCRCCCRRRRDQAPLLPPPPPPSACSAHDKGEGRIGHIITTAVTVVITVTDCDASERALLCREKRVSPILFDDDNRLEVSTTSLGLSHTRRTTSQTMFNISQSWQQFGIPSFDPQKCHLPCQFTRASVDLFFSAFPETLSQQCLNPAPRCGRGAPTFMN